MIETGACDLPFERLCFQTQTDARYTEILSSWSKMASEEKAGAWQELMALGEKGKEEMLPICVRCGVCCLKGGPTLTVEDLELVRREEIPWVHLMTLRVGEPVHSHLTNEAFFLTEERIKIREQKGAKACALYDDANKSCTIHNSRPSQCRAQACWDPTLLQQQLSETPLTRAALFAGVEGIAALMDAHAERASFERFKAACEALTEGAFENVEEVLDMLAFDEHVREYASAELGIPWAAMSLILGQPLAARVRLFGLEVKSADDGTRVLMPVKEEE
jgi:Fe-S-cluster containining protein